MPGSKSETLVHRISLLGEAFVSISLKIKSSEQLLYKRQLKTSHSGKILHFDLDTV
jgi:hypothetical protein